MGPFELLGVKITPIPLEHGEMEVLGFRFGRGGIFNGLQRRFRNPHFALLQDLDELILDALRDTPHPMHQTVAQALALVRRSSRSVRGSRTLPTIWDTRRRMNGCANRVIRTLNWRMTD